MNAIFRRWLSGLLLVPMCLAAQTTPSRRVAVTHAETLAVARREIPRGVALVGEDYGDTVVSRPGASPRHPVLRPLPGWMSRRVIHEGEVLEFPAIAPPPLFEAGDSVDVLVEEQSLALTFKAVAAHRAANPGDHVDVRMDDGRTLSVVAVSHNTVRLANQ